MKQCGRLAFYDKAYERVTPKNERAPSNGMGLFGLVFVGKSFPVDACTGRPNCPCPAKQKTVGKEKLLDVTQECATPAYD